MKGVFPILSTPFDSEDNIVFEDVQSEVDYAVDLIGDSFKISNPQSKSSCGCGVSFSL